MNLGRLRWVCGVYSVFSVFDIYTAFSVVARWSSPIGKILELFDFFPEITKGNNLQQVKVVIIKFK